MTPREKAIDLYNKFYDLATVVIDIRIKKYVTKQCALIAIDEIIAANPNLKWFAKLEDSIKYWQEVKKEIEKL